MAAGSADGAKPNTQKKRKADGDSPAAAAAAAALHVDKKAAHDKRIIYHGDQTCEFVKAGRSMACDNGAYWYVRALGQHLCGVHSKPYTENRVPLPKRSKTSRAAFMKLKMDAHEATITGAAKQNREEKKRGSITCTRMHMRRTVALVPGQRNVFPNHRDQNREGGFGCSSLSPKCMGPIDHKQPGLPIAASLENLHQANKLFAWMLDKNRNPQPDFALIQTAMYECKVPYRHQIKFIRDHPDLFDAKRITLPPEAEKTANQCAYSVWRMPDGTVRRFTYVESRQFYCHFYERVALASADFVRLKAMLDNGENLAICGYDAYEPTESLDTHYRDPKQPFGHELVLFTMLTVNDPTKYPWRKFAQVAL